MHTEKYTRYIHSALKHPERTIVAAASEITHITKPIQFHIQGDTQPISGTLPDSITRYMYLMEGLRPYEPETTGAMRRIIQPGDTVLVIGAHIGVHAILAKQLTGTEGVVVAFEPTPETYAILDKNCQPRNIRTEPLAVTKHGTDSIDMTLFDTRHSAWNSAKTARSAKPEQWNPRRLTVRATSVDAYCAINGLRTDVLIIDVENGEMDVLRGGETSIQSDNPTIIIECGDLGRTEENNTRVCLSLLSGWGYALFDIERDTGILRPHTVRISYPDDYPNVVAVKRP